MGGRDELAELRDENDALRREIEALKDEIDELHFEADLDACHATGLAAQLKVLIAEGDSCPNTAAHPLLERVAYTDSRSGEPMRKTRAYPLYREAFDAEAEACGIPEPHHYRG